MRFIFEFQNGGSGAWQLRQGFSMKIPIMDTPAFARHFVATRPLPTLPPYRSATGIGYVSKKLSKMAGISASYSPNSWWIDRL